MRDWTAALDGRRPPSFDPAGHRRVTVVAAHPDDETLGASGCLQALHRAGAEVTLVVATDGEAAYPALDADARRDLARTRRAELTAALRAQGLGDVRVHWLGLPDSGLHECGPALRAALRPLLADADAYLAPWAGDPHPDHRAAGLAAADVAPVTAHGWAYPIWMWAWLTPDDPAVPWERARLLRLDTDVLAAKQAAIAAFISQVGPGPDGSPPVLDAAMLAHTRRPTELLFRVPAQRVRARVALRRALRRRRPVAGRVVVRAAQARRRAGEPAARAVPAGLRTRLRDRGADPRPGGALRRGPGLRPGRRGGPGGPASAPRV